MVVAVVAVVAVAAVAAVVVAVVVVAGAGEEWEGDDTMRALLVTGGCGSGSVLPPAPALGPPPAPALGPPPAAPPPAADRFIDDDDDDDDDGDDADGCCDGCLLATAHWGKWGAGTLEWAVVAAYSASPVKLTVFMSGLAGWVGVRGVWSVECVPEWYSDSDSSGRKRE